MEKNRKERKLTSFKSQIRSFATQAFAIPITITDVGDRCRCANRSVRFGG